MTETKFNPLAKKGFDLVRKLDSLFAIFLKLDGSNSPMTGELDMADNAVILKDSNGIRWRTTINTDGALVTTAIAGVPVGSPWLFLFGNL